MNVHLAGTTPKDATATHHDAKFDADAGRPTPTWLGATGLVLTCKP